MLRETVKLTDLFNYIHLFYFLENQDKDWQKTFEKTQTTFIFLRG